MGNPYTRQLLCSVLSFLFLVLQTTGQNIGIGTTTPDPSAKVEIVATDKGMLIPRLTTIQRTGIVAPATGLLVFDTNTQGFWYWSGSAWQSLPVSNNVWSLSGNTGTNPATHFLGTTDNKPLLFKTNNQRVGYIGIPGTDGNIYFGDQSGISTTTGQENSAFGSSALSSNIGGNGNTAVGFQSLRDNTGGTLNSATGAYALAFNSTGHNNTANGYAALPFSLTGSNNTAIGHSALYNNEDGDNNIGIGYLVLEQNRHGSGNTAVGTRALRKFDLGDDNSAFGYLADLGSSEVSNGTAIGSRAQVNCSNCLVLGSINGVNGASADVNVGIGTANPTSKLEVNGKTQTDQLQVGTGTILSNIQSGTFTVGPSATGSLTVTLNFPTAFTSAPRVIATIRGGNFNDTFAVSTRSISTTQVVFNIQRVDINGSWAQNLQLDWIAIQ